MAPPEHPDEEPREGDETAPGAPRRRSVPAWAPVAAIVALVVVAAAGGYAGWAAKENHDRADRWRDRATQTQELLDARTKALNRQTTRLNVAATRLRDARNAIERSEEDVADLTERQRALAAEKAAVEDERAQLQIQGTALVDVANELLRCRAGLDALVDAFTAGLSPGDADVREALGICAAADTAIDAYNATYGGG